MHVAFVLDQGSHGLAFIDGVGGPELMLVLVIVLVLFGGKGLPEFARKLGRSIREFKKLAASAEAELRRALEEEPAKPSIPALPPPTPMPALVAPDPNPPSTPNDVASSPSPPCLPS